LALDGNVQGAKGGQAMLYVVGLHPHECFFHKIDQKILGGKPYVVAIKIFEVCGAGAGQNSTNNFMATRPVFSIFARTSPLREKYGPACRQKNNRGTSHLFYFLHGKWRQMPQFRGSGGNMDDFRRALDYLQRERTSFLLISI
jgi:hypothetical protein